MWNILFRDVQFNPHQDWQFSAVLENGKVQLWDKRRPDRYNTCEIETRSAKCEIFLLGRNCLMEEQNKNEVSALGYPLINLPLPIPIFLF
jgi:hypothetical protein